MKCRHEGGMVKNRGKSADVLCGRPLRYLYSVVVSWVKMFFFVGILRFSQDFARFQMEITGK